MSIGKVDQDTLQPDTRQTDQVLGEKEGDTTQMKELPDATVDEVIAGLDDRAIYSFDSACAQVRQLRDVLRKKSVDIYQGNGAHIISQSFRKFFFGEINQF